MAFLSDSEKAQITAAIRAVEAKSSGELVTVVAREADDYYYIPTLWAALIALAQPALVNLLALQGAMLDGYAPQVITFILLTLLFRLPALKYRLVPVAVKRERAHRLARQQFIEQNLHHTAGRTGVLLFVSVAEHYVEIIADKGINDVVPPGTWDGVVAEFVGRVRRGEVAAGFVGAVEGCGRELAQHFPVAEGDVNELPDHLVEL